MNLQFFGGSGAPSGRRTGGGGSTSLQPSPELNKVQPDIGYKDNIEYEFDRMLKGYKSAYGEKITEKDLQLLEDKMREMTNSDEVYVGIRLEIDKLGKILTDGRFKSQFETGTSGGMLSPVRRSEVEALEMGYPDSTNPKDRPVYGMLFDGEIKPSKGASAFYGGVVAIFKPSIKQYATVTMEDSLNYEGNIMPSPLLKPSRYSISSFGGYFPSQTFKEMYDMSKTGKIRPSKLKEIDYTEVQIHGGHATTSNIDRIVFSKNTPTSKIPVNELKKYGIKWEIEK